MLVDCSLTNFSRMCEEIDSSSLADIIRRSSESLKKVLIVDCRCFLDYNDSHIRSAINAFYSKMMRRRLKEDKVCEQFLLNHLLDNKSTGQRTGRCLSSADLFDLVLYDDAAAHMEVPPPPPPSSLCGRLKRRCPTSATPDECNEGTKFIRLLHEKLRSSKHFDNIVLLKDCLVPEKSALPRRRTSVLDRRLSDYRLLYTYAIADPNDDDSGGVAYGHILDNPQACECKGLETPEGAAGEEEEEDRSEHMLQSAGLKLPCSLPTPSPTIRDMHRPSSFLNPMSSSMISSSTSGRGFVDFRARFPELCESSTENGGVLGGEQPTMMACGGPRPAASLSQPCLPPSNEGPTKILPFLYLGSQQDALNPELLKKHRINYVINLSVNCPKPEHVEADEHFLRIPVNDSYQEKLLPHFDKAFEFLDRVRQSDSVVLIHCLAGISRSPTLAIAYIMRQCGMSSDEAYRYVKQKRPSISPNFNFMGQLLEYEKQLKITRKCEVEQLLRSPSSLDLPSGVTLDKEPPASAQPSIDSALGDSFSNHSSFDETLDQTRRCLSCPVKMAKSTSSDQICWEPSTEVESSSSMINENGKRGMQPIGAWPDRPRDLGGLRGRRAMHIPQAVKEDLPSPSSELSKLSFTPPAAPEPLISAANPFFPSPDSAAKPVTSIHRRQESQLTAENPVFHEPQKALGQSKASETVQAKAPEAVPCCSHSVPPVELVAAPVTSSCTRALARLTHMFLRRGPWMSTGGPTLPVSAGMSRSSTVGAFTSTAAAQQIATPPSLAVVTEQSRSMNDLTNLDADSPESGFAETDASSGISEEQVAFGAVSRSSAFRRGDPERDSIGSQSSLEICVQ